MHHWNEAHEGHTEHCCLCIPSNIGANIIGFLLLLSLVMNVLNAVGGVGLAQSVVGILLAGYPSFFFLKMLQHNTEDSRKHYAEAFKVFTKIVNVVYIITAILLLVFGIYGFVSTGAVAVLTASLIGVAVVLVSIFLLVHFNRVVATYANHAHSEGYEKH